MDESNFMRLVMLEASKKGYTLFRNNTGSAWMGKSFDHPSIKGAKVVIDARPVKFGVGGVGGSDLIGWSSTGLFTALEIKTLVGKASDDQINFLDQVKKAGGVAKLIRELNEI